MSNYPPGAANDPNAPYNQKDPVFETCDRCGGTGLEWVDPENHSAGEECCRACKGEGQIEVNDDDCENTFI